MQYDETAVKLPWNALPEGYCRAYADAVPAAVPVRRLQPGRPRGPARPRLLRRRPQGRPPVARLPAAARRQHDLLQPDLLVEVEPRLRHRGLQDDQPVLRDAEGVRPARAAGARAARCTSSSTACSTTCRRTARSSTATTTQRPSARASRPRPRTAAGSSSRTRTCRARSGDYSGWFGFDSIPVLAKSNPAVFDYFVGAQDSVTRTWLKRGADGWRLDVMGDSSFPAGYWDALPPGREGDRPERADRRRALAEGLDAAVASSRPPRGHDDELPRPRRDPRLPDDAHVRRQGLRRQRAACSRRPSSCRGSSPSRRTTRRRPTAR